MPLVPAPADHTAAAAARAFHTLIPSARPASTISNCTIVNSGSEVVMDPAVREVVEQNMFATARLFESSTSPRNIRPARPAGGRAGEQASRRAGGRAGDENNGIVIGRLSPQEQSSQKEKELPPTRTLFHTVRCERGNVLVRTDTPGQLGERAA